MKSIEGNILTPDGWVSGYLDFDQRIVSVRPHDQTCQYPMILPGFIDLHVHGGDGADTMEGADAINKLATWHARHGTTSLLATTVSAPREQLIAILKDIRDLSEMKSPIGARILGGHLEGPYINPDKRGALPPHFAGHPVFEDLCELCEFGSIRVITLAAEMIEDKSIITRLVEKGLRVQLGHSLSSYETALDAMNHGVCGFTHLFNAMSGLHHREPGMVGAALAKAEYAEIIPDLYHVHRGALLAALRAIPKLYCVTDSSAASGMPDGQYTLGGLVINKCPNGVHLEDGTIAGSTLTMSQAFLNLLSLGLTTQEAALRLSTFPADYLGLQDRGRIEPGAFADLVVLDGDNSIAHVFVEGEAVELSYDRRGAGIA